MQFAEENAAWLRVANHSGREKGGQREGEAVCVGQDVVIISEMPKA